MKSVIIIKERNERMIFMKKNKEKNNKFKLSKGELAIKIIAMILAVLMILSVGVTCIYYFF